MLVNQGKSNGHITRRTTKLSSGIMPLIRVKITNYQDKKLYDENLCRKLAHEFKEDIFIYFFIRLMAFRAN
jgi:hypothetical protein